jgi:hypothetical protein
MMQLDMFAAPPAPPQADQRYRIKRNDLWWDSRTWIANERMAMTLVGDVVLQRELATYLAGVDVEVIEG